MVFVVVIRMMKQMFSKSIHPYIHIHTCPVDRERREVEYSGFWSVKIFYVFSRFTLEHLIYGNKVFSFDS